MEVEDTFKLVERHGIKVVPSFITNRKILDSYGIPTYPTPRIAVKALNALLRYWRKKE